MRTSFRVAAVTVLMASWWAYAQEPTKPAEETNLPAPGTRGNADNVKYLSAAKKSDPSGNPIRLAKATGHVSNYSEDKVPAYTLPDPLVMSSGERVTSAAMWRERRRPEIVKLYEDEIYGRVPDNAPKVTWAVGETDAAARDGAAIMKRVIGRMGDKPDGPRMNLTVYLPAKATTPAPMLLSITFGFTPGGRGGDKGKAPGDGKAADAKAAEGKSADTAKARPPIFDALGELLSRGWGYATLGYTDIQPDRANQWTSGVVGLTLKEGQTQPAPGEWGTISAWSWGISRAIDYLETEKAVNPKQIAITGASRLGKTVLWASAKDERVAAVFSVVSGEMGAALIRRDWGETLDDMAQNFPWQFCGNMQKWAGRWNELPIDQHMLIALSAPRPVYVNGGLTDQWSDPKGEFLAMVAAGPVYRLLGQRDLGTTQLPALDTPLTSGDLAFLYHSGGHQAVPADWKAFLDFAERHFKTH